MDAENKFYRSQIYSRRYIIPAIFVVLLALYIINKGYTFDDTIIFIVIILFVYPAAVLCIIFFIYWLISLKNAKKSYIEFFTQSMVVDNYYGFFKIKEEFYEIKYDEIKEIQIFPIQRDCCHHVNIHKKHIMWKHDVIYFELKISDYKRFFEILNLYWINVSKQSYF